MGDELARSAERLAAYVAAQCGARGAAVRRCLRLSGGAIQENLGLALTLEGGRLPGDRQFVVRCDAPSSIAASLTRAQEFAVLRAAVQAGVTAPRPYWLCKDPQPLGVAFYVMEWAPGTAAGRVLTGDALTPGQGRALARRLGGELARLHAIRPPRQDLSFLPVPRQGAAQARLHTYRQQLDALGAQAPVLEYALRWLARNAPPAGPVVLVHSDFRTGNYLVHEGELSAILDWEFAAWGQAEEDLGWFCARSWRFAAPGREAGGIGGMDDLLEGYAQAGGQPVQAAHVRYWSVMACLRWAVIALQQAARHESGAQRSLELALTGRMLPEIEMDLLHHIEDVEATQ